MIPAVGQGVICAECLTDNDRMIQLLAKINHTPTAILMKAERGFLETTEGTCKTPIGACAEFIDKKTISLNCFLATVDGRKSITKSFSGDATNAYNLGQHAAKIILKIISE